MNKWFGFLMGLLLIQGTFAFAADDHDGWPEGTLLALEGADAISKQECFLFVTDVGYIDNINSPENFYAIVQTHYSHGDDQASAITVKTVPQKPGVLAGTGSNGQDQIVLFLNPADLDLRNVKSYNLKWLHGNHFHNNRCVNLVEHDHHGEDHPDHD